MEQRHDLGGDRNLGQVGGQVAGGVLGGAIGGVLGGPVGAWIGRAIGSRVGGMAGRAAAEAIASYMEGANEAAETETKEQEAAKTCVDCGEIDCFSPPEGSTPDQIEEFKRQLKEQQDAINDISPDQLVKNMENYEEFGRGAKDAVDRATARDGWIQNRVTELLKRDPSMTRKGAEQAAKGELSTMDVIHTPDLSAGGTGKISQHNGGMGPRSVNRSIGSQWSKTGAHVLGFGAFGKMIAWNETHQDMIIDLVKGMVSCPALTSGEIR
jgi:polyhydroxyalkanoate synthesis regulator phasin